MEGVRVKVRVCVCVFRPLDIGGFLNQPFLLLTVSYVFQQRFIQFSGKRRKRQEAAVFFISLMLLLSHIWMKDCKRLLLTTLKQMSSAWMNGSWAVTAGWARLLLEQQQEQKLQGRPSWPRRPLSCGCCSCCDHPLLLVSRLRFIQVSFFEESVSGLTENHVIAYLSWQAGGTLSE